MRGMAEIGPAHGAFRPRRAPDGALWAGRRPGEPPGAQRIGPAGLSQAPPASARRQGLPREEQPARQRRWWPPENRGTTSGGAADSPAPWSAGAPGVPATTERPAPGALHPSPAWPRPTTTGRTTQRPKPRQTSPQAQPEPARQVSPARPRRTPGRSDAAFQWSLLPSCPHLLRDRRRENRADGMGSILTPLAADVTLSRQRPSGPSAAVRA